MEKFIEPLFDLEFGNRYIAGVLSGFMISFVFFMIYRFYDFFTTLSAFSYLLGLALSVSAALELKCHIEVIPKGYFNSSLRKVVLAVILIALPDALLLWKDTDVSLFFNYMYLMLYFVGAMFALKSCLDFKIYKEQKLAVA